MVDNNFYRYLVSRIGLLEDQLPADDHAYALLPERRRAKVLVVTPGNTYLEAALLLDEYLDVQLVSPRDYAEKIAPSGQKHDVVVFDGVTPADPPRAHAIYLDPARPGYVRHIETVADARGSRPWTGARPDNAEPGGWHGWSVLAGWRHAAIGLRGRNGPVSRVTQFAAPVDLRQGRDDLTPEEVDQDGMLPR